MIAAAALTHPGRIRTVNEDAYLLVPPHYAVLDGMSGTSGGGVAAAMAHERLPRLLEDRPPAEALAELSRTIWQQGLRSRAMFYMGAAVVVASFRDGRLAIAHAGDCRAYLLHDGDLRRLTRDHVFLELEGHRRLVRHLGLRELVPETSESGFPPGARLLLCTDGLHKELPDEEIGRLLEGGTPEEACKKLVLEALERGGRDNVTALVAGLQDPAAGRANDPP